MRLFLNIVIGLILLAGAGFFAKKIMDSKTRPRAQVQKARITVFVDTVQNKTVPIMIPAHGNLSAVHKVELYAEVQGVFTESGKMFKPGQLYRKGDVLLKLDGREYNASLVSQRSNLQNLIAASLSDLKFDFPDAYPHWEKYLKNFDLSSTLPPIPEPTSQQESFFVAGRNIISTYYTIKNMEERYRKYTIRAPFDGILTEAVVNLGTLVRSGQKLGEFIDPRVYELDVAISKGFSDLLAIGKKVALENLDQTQKWQGTVVRVNGKVDPTTQTVQVFIQVTGSTLKEGMYLEANLLAREEPNALEIPRKLLVNDSEVYVVLDSTLSLVNVDPVFFNDKNVVVKGLPNGTRLVARSVLGAYEGMLVEVADQKLN